MTPERKHCLQWVEDGCGNRWLTGGDVCLSSSTTRGMLRDGNLTVTNEGWTLTDKGRQALHEG